MIGFQDFDRAIQFMKERDSSIDKINQLIDEEFEWSALYPYTKYKKALIDLLVAAVSDNYDAREDIEYFVYDLSFGSRWSPGCVMEVDGTDIRMETVEDLYNYIVENNNKAKL